MSKKKTEDEEFKGLYLPWLFSTNKVSEETKMRFRAKHLNSLLGSKDEKAQEEAFILLRAAYKYENKLKSHGSPSSLVTQQGDI
jgi:hypothetical protein